MRVTTAFNKMLAIEGASVAQVTVGPQGMVVDLRRRARRLRCPCGYSTRARPGTTPPPGNPAAAGPGQPTLQVCGGILGMFQPVQVPQRFFELPAAVEYRALAAQCVQRRQIHSFPLSSSWRRPSGQPPAHPGRSRTRVVQLQAGRAELQDPPDQQSGLRPPQRSRSHRHDLPVLWGNHRSATHGKVRRTDFLIELRGKAFAAAQNPSNQQVRQRPRWNPTGLTSREPK